MLCWFSCSHMEKMNIDIFLIDTFGVIKRMLIMVYETVL